MSHGSGPFHGKSNNKASKARRASSWLRGQARKDRNVRKSSHGKYRHRGVLAKATGQNTVRSHRRTGRANPKGSKTDKA